MTPCPCHSGLDYALCCQPFHNGHPAPTPLALMRSRYCAYALELADYIIFTTHPDNPSYQANKNQWREQILAFCQGTDFIGLSIDDATTHQVTFTAILRQSSQDTTFTETSTFAKQGNQWLYLKGEIHPR